MTLDQGPIIPRRRLGAEFKRLRDERGKKLAEVARDLLISTSKLSRLEKGQGVPQERDVRDLLKYYGEHGSKLGERMWRWAEEGREEAWWESAAEYVPPTTAHYIAFETAASEIKGYLANFAPTLLQTSGYSRALFQALHPELKDLEALVQLTHRRQDIIARDDYPVRCDMVVDEAVLLRMVGSRKIMHDQLVKLADSAQRPNVTLRVFPFSAGPIAAVTEGTFSILHYFKEIDRDVVALGSGVLERFLDRPEEIGAYREIWEALSRRSLTPEDSIRFVRRTADSYI